MIWKQLFFRILGVAAFAGGCYAFYDYGRELLPLFSNLIAGTYDAFSLFTVLSSFFIGAFALLWVGMRMIALRSFSRSWVYCAILPITAWIQNLYDIGHIATMDRILSFGIVYLCIYAVILNVLFFVHAHWYTPQSHESMRHVALEKSDTSLLFELRWILMGIFLLALLILHPADIGTTLDMVTSSIVYAFNFFR